MSRRSNTIVLDDHSEKVKDETEHEVREENVNENITNEIGFVTDEDDEQDEEGDIFDEEMEMYRICDVISEVAREITDYTELNCLPIAKKLTAEKLYDFFIQTL